MFNQLVCFPFFLIQLSFFSSCGYRPNPRSEESAGRIQEGPKQQRSRSDPRNGSGKGQQKSDTFAHDYRWGSLNPWLHKRPRPGMRRWSRPKRTTPRSKSVVSLWSPGIFSELCHFILLKTDFLFLWLQHPKIRWRSTIRSRSQIIG